MKLTIGDKVAYSARWLRSIGAFTGELTQLRGTVIALTPLGQKTIAKVQWADGEQSSALTDNLAKPGTMAFFAD